MLRASLIAKWRHLNHLFTWIPQSKTIDTLDSPYLVTFVKEVLGKHHIAPEVVAQIELIRKHFLSDQDVVETQDYGRGSFSKLKKRSISTIAKTALSSPRKCQLLGNIAAHYQVKTILELGTCLGISTYYLGTSCPDAKVISIEGHRQLSRLASHHLPKEITNIDFRVGKFAEVLQQLIKEKYKFGLIFIDGSHSSIVQEHLWPLYHKLSTEKTIFILDDIYWSEDMQAWWKSTKKMSQFNLAIDLYHFGILSRVPSIKEPIDVKIFPRLWRWQIGIRR